MNKPKNVNKRDKAGLAKLLRLKEDTDHFDFVWEELVKREIVEDWERGATSDKDILDDVEDLLRLYRRARKGRTDSSRRGNDGEEGRVRKVPLEPTERERVATDAFRKYLAVHAAKRPLVQRFRREHPLLQGKLLKRDEEIEAFLALELGVDLELEQYLDSYRGKPSNVLPFQLHDESSTEESRVFTDEAVAQIIAEEQSKEEQRLEDLWVQEPELFLQRLEEEESGPGGYLEELGEWLVNVYSWSHVGDAVVFVISGRPPRLAEPLVVAMDMEHATYSITFSPRVSEETVVRAYRTAISRHRRSWGARTVRVLRFVSEQADEEGRLPPWSQLLKQWNAANPDDRFSDRTGLYNAHKRAVKALVPPYLPLT